jgi:hypothetical protein
MYMYRYKYTHTYTYIYTYLFIVNWFLHIYFTLLVGTISISVCDLVNYSYQLFHKLFLCKYDHKQYLVIKVLQCVGVNHCNLWYKMLKLEDIVESNKMNFTACTNYSLEKQKRLIYAMQQILLLCISII